MHLTQKLFQRQTSAGRTYIPEIDGLRFVALLSVVLFHIFGQTMRYYSVRFPALPAYMFHNGDRGVRLFFVISGFILAIPFARHYLQGSPAVSIRRYFIRRVTRLEPPYIASLLLSAVLILLVLHEKLATIAIHLLATILYCHNLVFGQMSTIAGVAWSLEVEVQFYVLVPLLTLVFAVRTPILRRSILILGIVALGILQAAFPGSLRWQMSIGYFLPFFLAGFLLADFYLTFEARRKNWIWDLCSLCGWPLVFLMPDTVVPWVLPGLTVVLYWAAFHGWAVNTFFRNPVIACIGGACYSTYLLHFPVIALATRIAGHERAWLMWILSISLITIISGTFYLLVEKPCMDPAWPEKAARLIRHLQTLMIFPRRKAPRLHTVRSDGARTQV